MSTKTKIPSSRLSIAVVGGGRIGSTFSYKLARAGHQVTVIARPGSARLRQLQRDKGIILRTGDWAPTGVLDALDEQQAYDLVIVTTLGYQVDAVLPSLQRSRAKAIQFMFVTFEPERLRMVVGEARTSFGMPFIVATLDHEGRLVPTISKSRKTLHSNQRWADLFTDAGVPSQFEPNMSQWLRSHVPFTIACESVCVLAMKQNGRASFSQVMTAARGMKAGFSLVQALDGALYPRSKFPSSLPTGLVAFILWALTTAKPMRELLGSAAKESVALVDAMAKEVQPKGALAAQWEFFLSIKPQLS